MATRRGPGRMAFAVAVASISTSYAAVRSGRGDPIDRAARDALARPLGERADVAVGAATDLGSIYGLAGITAALAATGRRGAARDVAVAGGLAWALAQGMKPALHRPRPYQLDAADRLVAVPAGSSWPSGHAAVAGATAAALHRSLPPVGRGVAGAYVVTVGLSRLYVGVHHLTDVIAGAGVGVVSAVAGSEAQRVLARWRARRAGPVGGAAYPLV